MVQQEEQNLFLKLLTCEKCLKLPLMLKNKINLCTPTFKGRHFLPQSHDCDLSTSESSVYVGVQYKLTNACSGFRRDDTKQADMVPVQPCCCRDNRGYSGTSAQSVLTDVG